MPSSVSGPVSGSAVRTAPPAEGVRPAPPAAPGRPAPAGARRAPARPSAGAAFHTVSAAATALLALAALGAVLREPVLIPPLAASAALVHGAPTLPFAQPRSVLLGHLLGAATGYAVLHTAGGSAWAAAVAAALTLALTVAARAPHSPACATPVVIVLQAPGPAAFVPLLLGAGALLVLTEYTASRIRPSAPRYPAYWW